MRNTLTKSFFSGRRTSLVILLVVLHTASIAASAGVSSEALASSAPLDQATTDSGFAIVKGLVTDSLTGGYLSGAIVAVSGTPRTAITDSLGRFRIDNVVPGTRRVDVYHSRLDELGIALVTPLMRLVAGDSVSLNLAFPSAATIVGRLCDPVQRARGPAAVLGQVLNAEHETPVVGARLSFEWIEHRIERKRLKTSFEHRSAVSAAKGHFRFCGLPGELTGNLSASFGGDTTAKVGVRVDAILAVRRLYLAPAPEASGTPGPFASASAARSSTAVGPRVTASVTGKIVNAKGDAVSGARVVSDHLSAVAFSGEDGRFFLRGVRPGTRTINVRRIGFEPVELPVDITAEAPTEITVRLADFVPTLDTIVVAAMRPDAALARVGFSRRKKAGMGTFLGPDDVERMRAAEFVDLFSSVPMLRRAAKENGRAKLVGRPHAGGLGCVDYFVDGIRWLDKKNKDVEDGIEEFITPSEVGAIEVYAGAFAPGSFARGPTDCDMTVAIWTKPKLGMRRQIVR